jgi:hypothetical protein
LSPKILFLKLDAVLTLIFGICFAVIYRLSEMLGCNLDKETLSILIALVHLGVSPEALASTVKELRNAETSAQDSVPK